MKKLFLYLLFSLVFTTPAKAQTSKIPLQCRDTSGSSTAQSCATSLKVGPVAGDVIVYTTTTANTGALTLNVGGTGAVPVHKWLGTAALAAGDMPANTPVILIFDGTNWDMDTIGNAPGGLTSFSGDGTFATNSSSTGAVTLTLGNTGVGYGVWGNTGAASGAPGYHALSTYPALAFPTLNQTTTGTASGLTSYPTLCSGSQFSQGLSSGSNNCATPAGSISGLTLGYIPLAGSATSLTGNSHLDDGVTTAGTITSSEPIAVSGSSHGITIAAGTQVAGVAGSVVYGSDSGTTGDAEVNENNSGYSRICTAANASTNTGCQGSSSGINYFYSPAFAVSNAATSNALPGANNYLVSSFIEQNGGTFGHIIFNINTADAANNLGVCIFNSSGSLVGSTTAATYSSTGYQTVALSSSMTITPGLYFFAWTTPSTTLKLGYGSGTAAAGAFQHTTASTSTGGACGASITVPTQSVDQSTVQEPFFALTP